MLTIDALKRIGVNTEEGLGRCLNNEDFYFRMIKMALADGGFEKLETSLAAKDLDGAFEAAHALKGVLGNLALTPLFEPASELTELLRRKAEADYDSYLTEILSQKAKLAEICQE
ncbi:MAG: Hpt domain-containing protein [Eubacterium sp.]|nr:Hpt domain-containing protein [Eubacterium sp.]